MKAVFVFAVVTLALAVPVYLGLRAEAQSATASVQFFAQLSGPAIGGIVPHGSSVVGTDLHNDAFFRTEIGNINLPAGTVLDVVVDGTSVGHITLVMHGGMLRLTGQMIPPVMVGSSIAVRNGQADILAGTFAAPPTPSPTPSQFPTPTAALFAPLTGPVVGGAMPHGMASYVEFGAEVRRLNVFVDNVHFPAGTVLHVGVAGDPVGEIVLNMHGDGVLRLDTSHGDTVPMIIAGAMIRILGPEGPVLGGVFQSIHPSPSPSPSPGPMHNRFFGGRLNGEHVVPPVETDGRGLVGVVLSGDRTHVTVYLGFARLSGAQTTAGIFGPATPTQTAEKIFDLGTIGGTSGRFEPVSFEVTPEQVEQLRTGLWYVQIGTVNNPMGEIRGQIRSRTRPSGFSGADVDDVAVFRPSNNTWYVRTAAGYTASVLGTANDTPVSGDFDGDGITDAATFRDGNWLIRRSSDSVLSASQFGTAGDISVRGDWDGDGRQDLAVYRPSSGVWYIKKSNGSGYLIRQFGTFGDIPVPADLDGDGRTDIAVFRPSTGIWYSTGGDGQFRAVQFGSEGDVPIVGDLDGDGADDISVFRPVNGVWYSLRSSSGEFTAVQFGVSGDIPVAGNYDNDGITDIAVFRPSQGIWYVLNSGNGTVDIQHFGLDGDIPANR